MKKIIGIMSVRNVLSQGYPFLEAIHNFLSWGDILYISDGFSNDGTEKILSQLSKSKRIKIYKDIWDLNNKYFKNGQIIAKVNDNLLKKVKDRHKNDVIFFLQANEVTHENSFKELRELPEQYPDYKGYVLPYRVLVGPYQLQDATWRLRFVYANQDLGILADGTHIEVLKEINFKMFLAEYLYTFYRYITPGEFYFRNFRRFSKIFKVAFISKPIFRYGIIFPKNIYLKMVSHNQVYKSLNIYRDLKNGETWASYLYRLSTNFHSDTNKFYKLASNKLIELSTEKGFIRRPFIVYDHPAIMNSIINKEKYIVRQDIINKIIHL